MSRKSSQCVMPPSFAVSGAGKRRAESRNKSLVSESTFGRTILSTGDWHESYQPLDRYDRYATTANSEYAPRRLLSAQREFQHLQISQECHHRWWPDSQEFGRFRQSSKVLRHRLRRNLELLNRFIRGKGAPGGNGDFPIAVNARGTARAFTPFFRAAVLGP